MSDKLEINNLGGDLIIIYIDSLHGIHFRHNANFYEENEKYNKLIDNEKKWKNDNELLPIPLPPLPFPEYSVQISWNDYSSDLIPVSKEEYERLRTLLQ
jgi:hypothetical protein